jgi:dihydrolipoamide dehydrogenase
MTEEYDMSEKDFQVVVIGGGPGGYVAAIRCAQLGLKVACIEMRETLGGTCLNEGCIPSKVLLQATEAYSMAHTKFKDFGITCSGIEVNVPQMQKNKERVVKTITRGVEQLFKKNGVTSIKGRASFVGPHELEINDPAAGKKNLTFDNCIIATGSVPIELSSAPFDGKDIVSSTGALDFEEIPPELVVVGAGVIGLELASVWARLGSKVTIIEALPKILPFVDEDVVTELTVSLRKEGIKVITGAMFRAVKQEQWARLSITYEQQGESHQLNADKLLVAIGRRPNTEGLGLKSLGIDCTTKGFIEVNGSFQTAQKHIYAIGDVIQGPMLAHKAEEDGIACANIIGGHPQKVSYEKIPSVIYTWPEVAAVGRNLENCAQEGLEVKVGKFPFIANGRSRAMGESRGFVKLLADKHSDKLLGAQIVGPHASELITELALALEQNLTVASIAHTVHSHPTLAEAIKEAALDCNGLAIHK